MKEQNKTGGGQCPTKSLSKVEIKILNLLGKTFFEGCGTEEKGVGILKFKFTTILSLNWCVLLIDSN